MRRSGVLLVLASAALALAGCTSPFHDAARTSETTAAPERGFFHDGGRDGDTRGRSENLFEASLDDVTNEGVPVQKDVPMLGHLFRRQGGEQAPAKPTERLLIYHGQMALEVARAEDAIARFLARVQEWGGYLAQQQDWTVTVRLPAACFDEAFAELRGYGRVLQESRKANDVTEEFVDLGIRLENARKGRERLLALLEKADKVEDMLKIEEQLRRLTEEIERMEGRRKFLMDQVAMATIVAKFQTPAAAPATGPRRKPSRFAWINAVGVERVLRDF